MPCQDEGLNYYVFFNNEIPETKWGGEGFLSKVDMAEPKLDKLVSLYKEELLSFEEIAMKTGIEWWTIKDLFKKYGIERISLSERAQEKRARDFDLIYKLHYEEKTGLNHIYRRYGYSPTYIKSVLSDKGLETIKGKVNQYK